MPTTTTPGRFSLPYIFALDPTLRHCDIATLRPCDIAILRPCDLATLRPGLVLWAALLRRHRISTSGMDRPGVSG